MTPPDAARGHPADDHPEAVRIEALDEALASVHRRATLAEDDYYAAGLCDGAEQVYRTAIRLTE